MTTTPQDPATDPGVDPNSTPEPEPAPGNDPREPSEPADTQPGQMPDHDTEVGA